MATDEQQRIGITGIAPGMGVTSLVVAMAEYCARLRKSTAVVELSGNRAVEQIIGTSEPVEYRRIIWYPNTRRDGIADIVKRDYEVIIYDMGSSFYRIRDEWLRCNKRMVIGSLSPWRKKDYVEYALQELGEDRMTRGTIFYTNCGIDKRDKKEKREFYEKTGQMVYTLPDFEKLMHPTKEQSQFFQNIIR